MSRSGRINKSTAVGALAACAVIGATSPVWADSGSSGSSDTGQATSAQDTAVIAALRGEVGKLKTQLHMEDIALRAAQDAASQEAKELVTTKAEIAHLKANAVDVTTTAQTVPVRMRPDAKQHLGHHDCKHDGNVGAHSNFRDHGDHTNDRTWQSRN